MLDPLAAGRVVSEKMLIILLPRKSIAGLVHLIGKLLLPALSFMSNFLKLLSFAGFIFLSLSTAQAQVPDSEKPEKVLVEEVKVNVSALTAAGRFVTDLQKEDLVIMENGRLQHANTVRRVPADVLFLLDTGGTVRGDLSGTLAAARAMLNSLAEEDRVAVYQVGDRLQLIAPWTADKTAAIRSVQNKLAFGRRSALYKAVRDAGSNFAPDRSENRHIVLITAGIDSFNDEAVRNAAISALRATDINVHVISYANVEKASLAGQKEIFKESEWKPRRLPEEVADTLPDPKRPVPEKEREITPREIAKMPRLGAVSLDIERLMSARKRSKELDAVESFLDGITSDTNGLFLLPETTGEMAEKAVALAAFIDSQWVVAYTPKNTLGDAPPDDIRSVEVTSKRSGVHVQARRKLIATPASRP